MAASPQASANREREAALAALGTRTFDILVVGGGITGCGIARDAALRGFTVALVEKTDLAAGTSSKSSKLIHGGLRYLEQRQFGLVFEGTNERALLLQRARHLVRPLRFLVPAYKESRPGLLKLDVGLWIYDALSKFSSPKLHKSYRAQKLLEIEPGIRTESLMGGVVYYDCMTDDARLTLEAAMDARALGATVVNYAKAVALVKDEDGRVTGADIEEDEAASRGTPPADAGKEGQPGATPRRIRVRARVVVNATGPWTDEIRKLVGESRPILKPTKGVHVVVDAARLDIKHACVLLARADRRVMFAIPWGDRTVLGTTDTYYDGDPDRVTATGSDADYLLETANHYFPAARLQREDILSTWAGLRPLVAPDTGVVDASDVSREHHLVSRPGFITIAGGKLTTFRRMAAEVVDQAGDQLGKIPQSTTATRQLPGAVGIDSEEDLVGVGEALIARGVKPRVARHLATTYGARAESVARRAADDEGAARPLDPELPHVTAEIDAAVDEELARTLADALGRRVPLLLRARDQGLGVAEEVARRMARKLDWSDARVKEEIDRYAALVDETRRFRRD